MWASEYYGVTPDIIVFGKAVAGGFPLAGILVREGPRRLRHRRDEALTFGQWPVSLAAGHRHARCARGRGPHRARRARSGEYVTRRLREELQDASPPHRRRALPGPVHGHRAGARTARRRSRRARRPGSTLLPGHGARRGVRHQPVRRPRQRREDQATADDHRGRDGRRVIDVLDDVLTQIEGGGGDCHDSMSRCTGSGGSAGATWPPDARRLGARGPASRAAQDAPPGRGRTRAPTSTLIARGDPQHPGHPRAAARLHREDRHHRGDRGGPVRQRRPEGDPRLRAPDRASSTSSRCPTSSLAPSPRTVGWRRSTSASPIARQLRARASTRRPSSPPCRPRPPCGPTPPTACPPTAR